jgi:hypothetical protein
MDAADGPINACALWTCTENIQFIFWCKWKLLLTWRYDKKVKNYVKKAHKIKRKFPCKYLWKLYRDCIYEYMSFNFLNVLELSD